MARKSGLGRGLGALIPEEQQDPHAGKAQPTDVFFGGGTEEEKPRGGSARDLLMPRTRGERHAQSTRIADTPLPNLHPVPSASDVSRETSMDQELQPVAGVTFGELPVTAIQPNRRQPRDLFDEEQLAELASSIKQVGILQPIVVRAIRPSVQSDSGAHYELIMGERRWRAAQRAGLTSVPAIIRQTEDSDLLRDALLENLHRAQLNPLEEAAAYQQLMDDFQCTQQQLSAKIARSRSQIANTLRLLRLPGHVQQRVASGALSAGHARALLGLSQREDMEKLAERIVKEGLSVRTTEDLVARAGQKKTSVTDKTAAKKAKEQWKPTVERLTHYLDTRITVSKGKHRGKITIEFSDEDDLARIEEAITGSHHS